MRPGTALTLVALFAYAVADSHDHKINWNNTVTNFSTTELLAEVPSLLTATVQLHVDNHSGTGIILLTKAAPYTLANKTEVAPFHHCATPLGGGLQTDVAKTETVSTSTTETAMTATGVDAEEELVESQTALPTSQRVPALVPSPGVLSVSASQFTGTSTTMGVPGLSIVTSVLLSLTI